MSDLSTVETIISLQETESLSTEKLQEKIDLILTSLEEIYKTFQEPLSNLQQIKIEDNNRKGQNKGGTGHFPNILRAKYSVLHAVEIQELMTELFHKLKVENYTSVTMKIGDERVTYSIEEFQQLNNQFKANLFRANGREV